MPFTSVDRLPSPAVTAFVDPGNNTPSVAVPSQIFSAVLLTVTFTSALADAAGAAFKVENGVGTGVYVQVLNVSFIGVAQTGDVPVTLIVPAGRKWKYTLDPTAAITGGYQFDF